MTTKGRYRAARAAKNTFPYLDPGRLLHANLHWHLFCQVGCGIMVNERNGWVNPEIPEELSCLTLFVLSTSLIQTCKSSNIYDLIGRPVPLSWTNHFASFLFVVVFRPMSCELMMLMIPLQITWPGMSTTTLPVTTFHRAMSTVRPFTGLHTFEA